jgi:hypothetical protein
MNYKRAYRRAWALSALVHRYLSRDPIALEYLKVLEQSMAQIRWKDQQHYLRADRRQAARAAAWEASMACGRTDFPHQAAAGGPPPGVQGARPGSPTPLVEAAGFVQGV